MQVRASKPEQGGAAISCAGRRIDRERNPHVRVVHQRHQKSYGGSGTFPRVPAAGNRAPRNRRSPCISARASEGGKQGRTGGTNRPKAGTCPEGTGKYCRRTVGLEPGAAVGLLWNRRCHN